MAEIGHNSGETAEKTGAERLKQHVSRIENVMTDMDALKSDMKELFSAAKSDGFDTKIIRKLIAMRRRDKEELQEEHALMRTYAAALGMDVFE